jgi:hypothetical protein
MMRDDTKVRSLRIGTGWFRFFFYFISLLTLLAAGGSYFGYINLMENRVLAEKNHFLQRDLRHANMELERLQNIEQIIKSNDPKELEALFGSVIPETERLTATAKPVNLRELFQPVDQRQVSLDNIRARFDAQNLRVTFNINNLLSETLSGSAEVELLTTSGGVHKINLDKNDMAFQIQRFKQVAATIPLADEVKRDDVFAVRLIVRNPVGKVIFRDTYPLSHILA